MNFEALTRELSVTTRGKGTYEITGQLKQFVAESAIQSGQLTVFVQHTSASLVIMENADPDARTDLHAYFDHLVPETL
ncbi:MAG TPA: YjbQ family protein, partial [Verrucomicrobiales bacterium]|nr:YjbQ family protein [Verrucomicrobiales bacterium]